MLRSIRNSFISFFDVLTYSNTFISICVFCFTLQSGLHTTVPIKDCVSMAFINAVATFVLYNLQRLYHSAQAQTDERSEWFQKHRRLLFTSMLLLLISVAGRVLYLFATYPLVFWLYVFLSTISLCYFLPPFSFRKIGLLKPFYIGWIYVMSGGYLIFAMSNLYINIEQTLYLIAQWLWLAAICLPFDIRDTDDDVKRNIATFPVKYSIKQTKIVGYVLVVMAVILQLMIAKSGKESLVIVVISILTLTLIFWSEKQRHRFYFSVLADGLIILQSVMLSIAML
jgi:4-hydroxybenzoate polyprenyltransferase